MREHPPRPCTLFLGRSETTGRHGGYSSAGRAPGCGPGCRGFKSRYSPSLGKPLICGNADQGLLRRPRGGAAGPRGCPGPAPVRRPGADALRLSGSRARTESVRGKPGPSRAGAGPAAPAPWTVIIHSPRSAFGARPEGHSPDGGCVRPSFWSAPRVKWPCTYRRQRSSRERPAYSAGGGRSGVHRSAQGAPVGRAASRGRPTNRRRRLPGRGGPLRATSGHLKRLLGAHGTAFSGAGCPVRPAAERPGRRSAPASHVCVWDRMGRVRPGGECEPPG